MSEVLQLAKLSKINDTSIGLVDLCENTYPSEGELPTHSYVTYTHSYINMKCIKLQTQNLNLYSGQTLMTVISESIYSHVLVFTDLCPIP